MTHPDEQAANSLRRCRCGAEPRWVYSRHLWGECVTVACWECGLFGRGWRTADAEGHRRAAEKWAQRVSEA